MSDEQLTLDTVGAAHALWRGAPETERIAAARAATFTGRNRARYILELVAAGGSGLTDHEAAEACGFNAWTGAGSRRLEVVDENAEPLVRDSGRRRLSPSGRPCVVWVASPDLLVLAATLRDRLEAKAR